MKLPTSPIFICEHGDVSVYSSPQRACVEIEAIDIKNNEYIGFDFNGRKLIIKLINEKPAIYLQEELPSCPEQLEKILLRFLVLIGDKEYVHEKKELKDLVAYFKKFMDR
jgi:hypothetical protein